MENNVITHFFSVKTHVSSTDKQDETDFWLRLEYSGGLRLSYLIRPRH